MLNKYFVIVHIDVQERGDKTALMNAGGEEYMVALKGERAGLPFYAFVDSKDKMIVNAMQMKRGDTKGNIGHPVTPEEVTNFMRIVKKSAPKISDADAKKLEDWLRNQKIG